MRLLRLATFIIALVGGSIGLFQAPASATPLSASLAEAASGPLVERSLVQRSYYGYRRHYWRPRYYHRRVYWRPRYHYRRAYWRPRYYYRRHYWRPRFYHRRHFWRRHYWRQHW